MPKTLPAFDVMTDEELDTYIDAPHSREKGITGHNAAIDERWARRGADHDEDRALVKVGTTTYRVVHDRAPHYPNNHRITAVGPRGGVYRAHVGEGVITEGTPFQLYAVSANAAASSARPLKVQRAVVTFAHTQDGWVVAY